MVERLWILCSMLRCPSFLPILHTCSCFGLADSCEVHWYTSTSIMYTTSTCTCTCTCLHAMNGVVCYKIISMTSSYSTLLYWWGEKHSRVQIGPKMCVVSPKPGYMAPLNMKHSVATMRTEDVAEMKMRYISHQIYNKKYFWSSYDIITAPSHM